LAGVGVVDLVVGTHDAADAGADGFGEGPEVEFVHCAVVEVGCDTGEIGVTGGVTGLTEVFLFV